MREAFTAAPSHYDNASSFAVVEGPFDQSQIPDKPIMFTCERVQMRTGPYLHANVGFKPMSCIPSKRLSAVVGKGPTLGTRQPTTTICPRSSKLRASMTGE
jgi:hypothetical protein